MLLSGTHAASEHEICQVSKVQKEGIRKLKMQELSPRDLSLSVGTESFSEDDIFISFQMCIYCPEILELREFLVIPGTILELHSSF